MNTFRICGLPCYTIFYARISTAPRRRAATTLEERIARCPIHTWANVDSYFDRASVPHGIRGTFRELLLVRGEYPVVPTTDQAQEFARRATRVVKASGIGPLEGNALSMLFADLTGQWVRYERNKSAKHN